jgi:hypothetical protein
MVPPPFQHPEFERGKFNPRLQSSLKIEICELEREPADLTLAATRPKTTTACAAKPLIEEFLPGSVDLVGMPSQQTGWWSNFNLPSDGFYKALWDTRQENLALDKYYRIKVLIDGSEELLGYADVDPVSNMREWKHVASGEVVTMIDDTKLPIAFRVETGALCDGGTQCTSATVTNDNPNGDSQILQVTNENGEVIAGVLLPDGWLPLTGPQSVVFTITRVNTGVNNIAAGTQQFPCHANLPLQQFDACFNYSTIPELDPIDDTGRQFAVSIIAGVCFVLHDTEDPREDWVQLWSSEPGVERDTPKPLRSADASAILTGEEGRNCGTQEAIIGSNSSNPLTRFAGLALHKLSRGAGRLFGVKTAYAVDLGIGGILDDISNIGPAMTARMEAVTPTEVTVTSGFSTPVRARIVGTKVHNGDPLGAITPEGHTRGIPGLPMTFVVETGNGTLSPFGAAGSVSQLISETSANVTSIQSTGIAGVNWTPPATPGTYTLTATAAGLGSPITFTATVPPLVGLSTLSGNWINEDPETGGTPRVRISTDGNAVSVHAWGACSPTDCDWGTTIGSTARWASDQEITAVWDQDFVISTLTITSLPDGRLRIVNHYDFVPPDTRIDFTSPPEFFTREVVTGVDQSHTSGGGMSALINECCRYVAQVFIPGVTGTLAGVNVEVISESAHALHVAIHTTENAVPTQTVLGERTLDTGGSSISELITFPQTISLTAGVPYAIVVSYPTAPPSGGGQAQGQWVGTTGDAFLAGILYMSVDGTSWFTSGGPGNDGLFRTYMSVPTP